MKFAHKISAGRSLTHFSLAILGWCCTIGPASALNLANSPLYLTSSQPPLILLTMARDHTLYYEAYNDYSDLDGDGTLDVGYKPSIEYYGYFDSYKCYAYASGTFTPMAFTANKKCTGTNDAYWSGDFLNYVTTSRIDALRKTFYGGQRSTDTATQTILERAFIPQDAHSWGKEYTSIAYDGYDISEYTPLSVPQASARHLFANTTLTGVGSAPLMRVLENSAYRIWEWVSIERPVAGDQCATGNNVRGNCVSGAATRTDYTVRVEVCKEIAGVSAANYFGREANCQAYGSGGTPSYKPTGLLHKYGQNEGMFFGLLSGSYDQNTNGGILRKPIGPITNEIETETGIFKETGSTCGTGGTSACVNGIVGTINRFRVTSFNYSNHDYSCGWITTRAMNNGECEMWGNPIGEMMYEGLRYFAGQTGPTSSFVTSTARDDGLGLPKYTGTWPTIFSNATTPPAGQYPKCSKPYFMLVSDVLPSFDSDSVPGADSNFGTTAAVSFNGNALNASSQGQSMWNIEFGGSASPRNIFIGQVGSTYDGAPTVKTATSFGNIRGLSPNDPTRQGSYYAASVAYFSHINDINAVSGSQKVGTYSIALAAPLPRIEIPIPGGTNKVVFVPFAKSVKGSSINASSGNFQPTNQIVDFYVDTIKNTTAGNMDPGVNSGRPYYKFRINYEDVEQGADHDMDAIATYEILLNAANTVTVNVTSDYAAGGITQHMGYVVSGTAADGVYLVVRDSDTAAVNDPDYFLDSPNIAGALPLSSSITFTPSANSAVGLLLKDPLWYAAKFGGFNDDNGNGIPETTEWDADNDGVPDSYFLVVNPLKMQQQMDKALAKIRDTAGSSAALSTNSFSFQTDTLLFQTRFNSDGWFGELNAYPVTANGISAPAWQAQQQLAAKAGTSRVILTYDVEKTAPKGIPFRWASMTTSGIMQTTLNKLDNGTIDNLGSNRVDYLRGEAVNAMRTRPNIPGTTIVNKLGDVINSQAQYVGRPNFGYGDASYAAFSVAQQNRIRMVYVGANDGMLHGFKGTTGEELLAYVPSEMFRTRNSTQLLSKLTQPDYGKTTNPHRYYVDGTPTMGDICTGGCATAASWKTILVGGLNGGGQGIYALDITDPANFTEANASGSNGIVKWEFIDHDHDGDSSSATISGDADLGYTYSRPFIVRLCTSRDTGPLPAFPTPKACNTSAWYVIFGNGYNNTEADGYASATGDAVLYILNADTGYLVKKIAVKEGNTVNPNGLSELAPIDIDGDGVIEYIYAGDLKGNMWRFNVYDDSVSNWEVAFGSASNPDPLYVAKDEQATPVVQPITTAADVITHPEGGLLVTFGTGSYIATGDPATTQVQTIYGIWDNNATISGRTSLVQQSVITATVSAVTTNNITGGTTTSVSHEYRTVTNNTVDWQTKKGWYINLPDNKERVAYNPEVRGGNVLKLTSLVPSEDVCEAGGYSWEYYVDALTGGRLAWSVFMDLSGIQTFGTTSGYASARRSTIGIAPPSTVLTEGKGRGTAFESGSSGEMGYYKVNLGQATAGRVAWREILGD